MDLTAKINGKEKNISGDLIEINKELLKYDFSDVGSISIDYFDKRVVVNLKDQEIFVDGKKIDLELGEKLSNVRWINFRRNFVSYRMAGNVSRTFQYGIGFQGTLNNQNIQRILLLNEGGYTLEKKK